MPQHSIRSPRGVRSGLPESRNGPILHRDPIALPSHPANSSLLTHVPRISKDATDAETKRANKRQGIGALPFSEIAHSFDVKATSERGKLLTFKTLRL